LGALPTPGLGADHPLTVGARLALVQTLKQFGQYDAAIAESVDLCGDIEGAYGRFHTYSLKCQETVADIEFTTGKLGEAEKTLLLIADLIGRSLPTVDGQWLGNLAELAELYRQQGRYQESKDLLSSTIGLALQTGNVESSYLGKSYLGRVLADEGDYQHAATVTKEVLDYRIANAATDPVSIYNTLLVLGAIYQAQGKLGDAESSFKEAYEGLVQAVGEDNPSTLVATNNLGQIYEQIGLYDQAEPMLKTALERLERVLGPTHPDTIRARNNLALLHESQGNFREAEPLYQLSLDQMTAVHGENYTDTVAVQNNLAYLYMLMEDYDGAVTMFEQVLQKWTTIFGPEHQNTLKALNNLARAYQKLGRLAEAEPRFLSAYQTRAAVLGQDHLDTIRSMIDLGGLYLEQGRLGEANDLLTAALDRAERILTEQHPYTFDALNMLARVKRAQGATQAALDLMEKGMQRRSVFLDRMLWTTGENAREGYLRLFRPELNEYLSLIAEAPNADSGRRAIEASLQRKGLLLKVTSEIQQIAGLSLDPTLTQLAERLRAARKALASLTLSGPTPETQGRHVEALYELEQQVNELQGELVSHLDCANEYRQAGVSHG
jgi:tetratricopeptide (TPR) repeat protein